MIQQKWVAVGFDQSWQALCHFSGKGSKRTTHLPINYVRLAPAFLCVLQQEVNATQSEPRARGFSTLAISCDNFFLFCRSEDAASWKVLTHLLWMDPLAAVSLCDTEILSYQSLFMSLFKSESNIDLALRESTVQQIDKMSVDYIIINILLHFLKHSQMYYCIESMQLLYEAVIIIPILYIRK